MSSPILIIHAEIYIQNKDTLDRLRTLRSEDASFGRVFPEKGFVGRVIGAQPLTACHPIEPAPLIPPNSTIEHWIVLIARYGGCNFEKKIQHATNANFSAAIVYNVNSDRLIPMGGSSSDDLIPSTFIGYTDGDDVLRRYTYKEDPFAEFIILPEDPFDINTYLLPFAIVVGLCFIIVLIIVAFKCVQDYRRTRRHRLPRSALKKLPVIKFKTGEHPYDSCCICIEDYKDNDKLRILPCDHAFHKQCIDPWLVKNKRVCPMCRKKVFPNQDQPDSDDSDNDDSRETAPLLRNYHGGGGTGGGGGTFEPQTARDRAELQRIMAIFDARVAADIRTRDMPNNDATESSDSGSSDSNSHEEDDPGSTIVPIEQHTVIVHHSPNNDHAEVNIINQDSSPDEPSASTVVSQGEPIV